MARQRSRRTSSRRSTAPASSGMTRAMSGLKGFADMAAAAFGKVLSVMERLVPVAQLIVELIGTFATTSVQVVGAAAESFTMLVVAISTATVALITFVKFMDELGLGQLTIIGQFRNIGTALKTMKEGFSSVGSFVAGIPSAIGSAFMSIPNAIGSAAAYLTGFGASASEAADGAGERFKSAFAAISSGAKRAFSAMVSAVASFGSAVGRYASQAASSLSSFVMGGLSLASRLGAVLGSLGATLGDAAGKIVGPLTEAGKQFAAAGTAAAALAVSSGLSVRSVTELGYAAEQAGGSAEAMVSAVESMNNGLLEAAAGSKTAAKGFEQLGFDVDNLLKQDPETRFLALGTAIAQIESPLDRAAAASAVFGSSSESLVGMFAKGTAGINEMRKEAERLGLVMTGPQAAAAKALTAAYKSIQDALTGLWRTLGAAVAPQLTEAATLTANVVKAVTAWVSKNGALVAQVFRIASAVAAFASGLTMAATVLTALSPALLATSAALAVGWKAWGLYGLSANAAVQKVMTFLQSLWAEVSKVIGGVKDAIAGGDLGLAVEVAFAGMQQAWVEGARALADISGVTMGGILNSLAAGDWKSAADQAWTAIQGVFSLGISALDDVWTGLQNTIDSVITYMRQQIGVAIHELARLAMAGLQSANNVANILAKYDPTGKIAEAQMAVGKALKGSALVGAAKTGPDAANAALDAELANRQAGRLGGLGARQDARDAAQQQRGFQQQVDADKAQKDAAQKSVDVGDKLQAALDKAAAARDAAAMRPVVDLEKRGQLAAAAAPSKAGGGFGATFSGAALVAMSGGGGSVQKEIAVATKATAAQVKRLADQDAKRQKEERAFLMVGQT